MLASQSCLVLSQDEVRGAFVFRLRSSCLLKTRITVAFTNLSAIHSLKILSSLLSSPVPFDTHVHKKKNWVTVWRCTTAPSLSPFVDSAASTTNTDPLKHAATRQLAPRTSSDVAIPQPRRVAEEKQTRSSVVSHREQEKRPSRHSSTRPKPTREQPGVLLQIERCSHHGQARQKQQVRLHQPAQ